MSAARAGRIAMLVAVAFVSTAFAETPEEGFHRGNEAYEAGRYEEAAEAYRTLERYGIHDARVEYNLGNVEFRLGRLGHAILHYERARRLDPTDPDIRSNLELARSMIFDRVEVQPEVRVVSWVRDFQDRLGPDRQAWIGLGWIWIAAGLVAWCSARPDGWNGTLGWILAGLCVLISVSALSWNATYRRLEGGRQAVVLEAVVEVLNGPGENNAALFTVHEGLTLEVRAERDEWVQVELPNRFNGWIRRDALDIV